MTINKTQLARDNAFKRMIDSGMLIEYKISEEDLTIMGKSIADSVDADIIAKITKEAEGND